MVVTLLFTVDHNQQQYMQNYRQHRDRKRRQQHVGIASPQDLSYLTHVPQGGDRHPKTQGGYPMEYMQNADTADDLTQSTEQCYEVC